MSKVLESENVTLLSKVEEAKDFEMEKWTWNTLVAILINLVQDGRIA